METLMLMLTGDISAILAFQQDVKSACIVSWVKADKTYQLHLLQGVISVSGAFIQVQC